MRILYRITLTLFLHLCTLLLLGQNINPNYNNIFVQNELTVIELELDEADKQNLVFPDDPFQDIYYPATIHLRNSKLDTIFGPVGIRIRGNTSRSKYKKSFKIDFKEYGGEQVYKLKKLNLKPNTNDPSMLREPISWIMYRNMNVPAARTSFVELFMNEEFMGVYQNVENIDDEFVDRRYGNENGNLYKCTYGATLDKNLDLYNNKIIELKTNTEVNDRSKLVAFVNLLNSTPGSNWETQLEAIFDVDNYLRQLAVESMIGHWDGYSFNINNYYLYENPETQKIHYIPYDLDNTWGIDWIGPDWGKEDLLSWHSTSLKVPLNTQILKSDKYFQQYILYLNEVLDNWFSIENHIWFYFNVIYKSVEFDEYFPVDFGFTYNDFLDASEVAWGHHVDYSLMGYIQTRYDYALEQIPRITDVINFSENELVLYPNPSNGMWIRYKGTDQTASPRLFDAMGRTFPVESASNSNILFKNQLPNGIYFLKIGHQIQKFNVIN